jgi:PAS domain S-box-containing protein
VTDATPAGRTQSVDAARLIEQVVDYAIIALDGSGTIESWNAGAQRLKGYTSEEAIGRSFSMFYSENDRRSGLPLQLLEAARRDGSVENTGWRVRQDGSRFWGDVIITALVDDSGQVTGFAKVTRDLTERKELEDAQAAFLAAIAHDFRTPVTAMKGFTELARDADPVQLEDFLTRIDNNADRLMQMMRDLVSYATVHAVQVQARPEVLDLADLIRDTVSSLASTEDLGRVSPPEGRVLVTTDRAAMERVVTNLVVNALKYSDGADVDIEIERDGSWIRFSVRDSGRGIDAADLATIFDEYARGRLAEEDGGQGLGLASVRSLVEHLGGRVSIESALDQGTIVTVELPAG